MGHSLLFFGLFWDFIFHLTKLVDLFRREVLYSLIHETCNMFLQVIFGEFFRQSEKCRILDAF